MTAKVHIPGQPAIWLIGDGTPPTTPHVALAPGADLPLLPVDLPDGIKGRARDRAGCRKLAEQLALPPDRVELHPFRQPQRPWSRAIAADPAQLSEWRHALGRGAHALLPDYLALPCANGVWTVEVTGDTVRARLGPEDGFTAEPELAALLLERAISSPPQAVLRLGAPHEAIDSALRATRVPLHASAETLAQTGHRLLRWPDATRGCNLRAPLARRRTLHRNWAPPAAVAGLALATWLTGVAFETRDLQYRDATARHDTEAMLRAHVLPTGPILDIRAQVDAALAKSPHSPPADPFHLFQRAAQDLATATVRSVEYSADTGLIATVETGGFAELEALARSLRGRMFAVEIRDPTTSDNGVSASLTLTAATGSQ
ncbi:type II secretion system protein GspL [Pseudoruegeria sp. HB172150]|uniref:type II secretion system protein GspL n=1 Tax=Pseudoruegeria sp. HB172150 TaxID=2721164 RepID=UPI001552541F|nr:type II secretion system protein GspL [Pseudoruegeria sp. HB172150]